MLISSANLDSLKTRITTVEQLHAWSGLLLHRANPVLKVQENIVPEFALQANIFTAQDETIRMTLRASIRLLSDYTTNNPGRLWLNAMEYSTQVIPASFLS